MAHLFAKLSSNYFWYFAVLGLAVPFLALFLDGRGYDSLAIGQILAIFTATKIFGPTLWAIFADKTGKQLAIIRLGAFLALVTFTGLFFANDFWSITLCLALFSLFWTAILPQLEVLTLTSIKRSAKIYARIRLWGSIGFIVFAMSAGEIIATFGSDSFIAVGALVLLGLLVSTLVTKQPPKRPSASVNQGSIFTNLIALPFVLFFVAGLLLQVSFGPFYSFFALYLRDLAYPSYAVGVLISIGVVAEIVIFIVAGRLFQLFGIRSLLAFSILVTSIRWWLTGTFGDSAIILTLTQLMHAASFGLYHSASVQFIQMHFARNQQNRGQAIYIGGVYGIGGALGAYLAGVYWQDGAGAEFTFFAAALVAFIATIIVLLIPRGKYN